MKLHSIALKSLSLAALLLMAQSASASIRLFTNESAYLSAVGDTGVDKYDDLPFIALGPLQRNAGDYSYSVGTSASSHSPFLFSAGEGSDTWLSTDHSQDILVFNHFSNNVRGVGGLFFNSDLFGQYTPSSHVTLTATEANGTTYRYTFQNPGVDSFVGFVATGKLSNITLRAPRQDTGPFPFPTVNNLHLSAAAPVPEAETYAMLMAGLGVLGWMGRRKRA